MFLEVGVVFGLTVSCVTHCVSSMTHSHAVKGLFDSVLLELPVKRFSANTK